jgi:ElaB/YqjD/DUF883 family membrane-anchored ribosome-binding protein
MSESTYPSSLAQPFRTDDPAGSGGNGAAVHQQPLTDRMAQGAHHTLDRLAETAAPHLERMEGALAGATGQLKEQARHVREKGDEWADGLRATVRRNPLSAVVAAMAIGALIARITR